MIADPLFEKESIRFCYIDLEKDPQVEAEWSCDLEYVRVSREGQPPRLLLPKGIREIREKQIKEAGDNRLRAFFAIRTFPEDELIGFFHIPYMTITNHNGRIALLFGSMENEVKYGDHALRLGLRYVFDELNFHRVSINLPEYAQHSIDRVEKFGFCLEVCRRESIFANGRYWNQLRYGMLEATWQALRKDQ